MSAKSVSLMKPSQISEIGTGEICGQTGKTEFLNSNLSTDPVVYIELDRALNPNILSRIGLIKI